MFLSMIIFQIPIRNALRSYVYIIGSRLVPATCLYLNQCKYTDICPNTPYESSAFCDILYCSSFL